MADDTLDYSKFDNDPGDERSVPDEEMFELSLGLGHTPKDYPNDPAYAKRYAKWLRENPEGTLNS